MRTRRALWIGVAAGLAACGGDPAGPARPELAGIYLLTELRFDPQGLLPEVDLRERLDVTDIQLVLSPDGQAQLRFVDPGTGLLRIVDAAWSTPVGGVRVHFEPGPDLRLVLLSARMTFAHDPAADAIRFDDAAPDGVDRQRLLELVPEWSQEQLLSPVPGRLVVEFTRAAVLPLEAS
jgi:hypothetical protein